MTPEYIEKITATCIKNKAIAAYNNKCFGKFFFAEKERILNLIKNKSDYLYKNFNLYRKYCSLYKGFQEGIEQSYQYMEKEKGEDLAC